MFAGLADEVVEHGDRLADPVCETNEDTDEACGGYLLVAFGDA